MLKLGKAPATQDDRDFKLEKYATILEPPTEFGLEKPFPPKGWGMLGNDEWGDCAWAGPAHETMMLSAAGGRPASFTTAGVLSDYSAGTGFDPHAGPPEENPTDRGSNVREVLGYRRKTGIVDAHGKRHKIDAYLKLDHTLAHIYTALYLFGAVGIGIEFPESAMQQFNEGKPWSVVKGASIDGGHYIPIVAKRSHLEVVSWGEIVAMTTGFLQTYADEIWAYVSTEDLIEGESPAGLDVTQLRADLAAL